MLAIVKSVVVVAVVRIIILLLLVVGCCPLFQQQWMKTTVHVTTCRTSTSWKCHVPSQKVIKKVEFRSWMGFSTAGSSHLFDVTLS